MRSTLIAVAALAILAGCSTYDSVTQRIAQSITPYRITVVQGNFVSKEAASQMQVGMSRAQVRQLLGTPLLADMFHADRWDYVFYFKRGSTNVVQQRDFIVKFAGDSVASWSGGEDLPSNLELLAEIDGDKRGKKSAAPVAASAAGASAPAAAAAAPVTVDTARSPSVEGAAAAAAPSTDPNAEAAQAANRATNAVQTPSRNTPSSVRSTAPTANAGGVPPQGPTSGGQPQFQFHRPPPPPSPSAQDNPVGPAGSSQSGSSPTYNAPLTAPSTSGTSQ
ncbi:outer membrane protein assembly factor BamE [bacterium M00.F.Ca.ET.228.01.1.1]|uniref:outer membrane protein assembly factor BamE n=1 Tax=Paraburkholderia phenoliruptrix TaxID=252970 RepID=UPI001091A43A|nr:outer membrane protein assembly factor BamE [Paraburkholderia phenoliruptrix]TGP44189.1 outer membrane protein assembly factor BamE [bacterium M00.F.Ca.ET.228.01.1.1]TGS01852.1 outer membrane protein assembly factor BamE [bacterium M00.F.Ca.ET.191.01.1.1]TGU08543.1 outer membrane protein assembly factor BamE [bacterium M00.F.Ca.ET.155.01.1.1]MBW0450089.1 outer membrane protein assembly factor BamE [Paraburkholderia phenoliruptrix]MBW9101609.1 outer membrane protein assembly factor BamE [Par